MIELLLLRVVHILCGMFWVGHSLFTVLFLTPVLMRAGQSTAATVMAGLKARQLYTVLPTIGVLTIASGARLMWITSGGFSRTYFTLPMGRMLAWGALFGIAAFCVSLLVVRPASSRALRLAAMLDAPGLANDHETISARLARARVLTVRASATAMVLVVLSAMGMAAARYAS
jgi:hypothetical protein